MLENRVIEGCRTHYEQKERCIYCDIIKQETRAGQETRGGNEPGNGSRVVLENEHFLVATPFAPRFPFETWILPKKHDSAFENSPAERFGSLARALKTLAAKLDTVLDFPAYNMVIHSAPVHDVPTDHYHWHVEVMPKLTKVAGFEWGTGFYINPTSPEESAKFLREAKV